MTNQRKWVLIEAHNLMSMDLASVLSVAVAANEAVAADVPCHLAMDYSNGLES